MRGKIVILGSGPVGKDAAERLVRPGTTSRWRSGMAARPGQRRCVRALRRARRASVRAATAGAAQVVAAFGFAYDSAVWRKAWPQAMGNLIDACEAARARLVFFDNLYMYGPQTAPLTEATR